MDSKRPSSAATGRRTTLQPIAGSTGGSARPATPTRRPATASKPPAAASAATSASTAMTRPTHLSVAVPSTTIAAAGTTAGTNTATAVGVTTTGPIASPSALVVAAVEKHFKSSPRAAAGGAAVTTNSTAAATTGTRSNTKQSGTPAAPAGSSSGGGGGGGGDVRQSRQTMNTLLSYLESVEAAIDDDDGSDAATTAAAKALVSVPASTASPAPAAAAASSAAGDAADETRYSIDRFDPLPSDDAAAPAAAPAAAVSSTPAASRAAARLSATTTSAAAPHASPPSLAENVFDGVRAKMIALRSTLDDREQTIKQLNQAIEHAKKREEELRTSSARQSAAALASQKKEYETAIGRHLSFIEKTIKDKEELTRRCEGLANESQALEAKYVARIDELTRTAAVEAKKARDNWMSAEKVRRQTWANEQTRAIKESTVRALEPEIQRLIAAQKVEIKRIDTNAKEQIAKAVETSAKDAEQRCTLIRQQLTAERDAAIELERNLSKQRMRDQIERYDGLVAAARTQAASEFEIERKKLTAESTHGRDELARAVNAARRSADERIAALNDTHRTALSELARKHELALAQAREQERIERDSWQASVIAKLNSQLNEKSNQVSKELTAQQREELELIITRLGNEQTQAIRDVQTKADQTIAALKKTQTAALSDAKKRESALNGQILALTRMNAELENRVTAATSKVAANQLSSNEWQSQVKVLSDRVRELEASLAQRASEMDAAFAAERATLNANVSQLQAARDDERRRHADALRTETEAANKRFGELESAQKRELDTVHERVKATIAKKDQLIASLNAQLTSKEQRIAGIEKLLAKQQKDLAAL